MTPASERVCRALGVELAPGVLRYRASAGGASVGVYLLKAPDIARMLATSALDLGLTGDEWLLEHGVSRGRWCLGGGSYVASVCLLMAEDDRLPLGWVRSVVTPYPNLARTLVGDLAPDSQIMTVIGSSEGLVPDVGDACLDVVETGSTAALNRLVVRQNFQRVTTHFARSDRARPDAITPILDVIAAATTSEA
jgi:ATP phosphoribosyltransferase